MRSRVRFASNRATYVYAGFPGAFDERGTPCGGMLMEVGPLRSPRSKRRPRALIAVNRDERGASAVEFAIVLSLLLLFVFGTIQFGMAYNRDQGLKAAAREGARVASVGGTETEIKTRVQQAQSLFAPADIKIKIDFSTNNGSSYSSPICDDAVAGNECIASTGQTPCGAAGIANLVRVNATVPGAGGRYAIIIPLWGNANITFSAQGVFRCESNN
jgi:Flp pilus assembly protein TadG